MIPILFDKNAIDFNTYGIGVLADTISCIVTEERNGSFELEMEYPSSGVHFSDIELNNIIVAKPNDADDPQAFRIYYISTPISEIITICAEHISYQLNYIPIGPITGTSCADVMSKIKSQSLISNPFNFSTDKDVSTVFTTGEPMSVRSLLGGDQDSILQQYQGEYKWDNWDVSLLVHRGSDNGVSLHYGKNITDFEKEEDMDDTVTGVLPYWRDEEMLIVGDISTVTPNPLPFQRVETVDVSGELSASEDNYGQKTYPTKAQVTAEGLKVLNNKSYAAISRKNIVISFVSLWQTEEYKDVAPLERVGLCDIVTVVYDKLGITVQSRVIKTEYNVLLERYNEIEIGDTGYNFATAISETTTKVMSDWVSRIEKLDNQIVLAVSGLGKIVLMRLGVSPNDPASTEFFVKADNISLTAAQAIHFMAGGSIDLTAENITISSDNFHVDEDGNIIASNANFTNGSFTGTVRTVATSDGIKVEVDANSISFFKNNILLADIFLIPTSGDLEIHSSGVNQNINVVTTGAFTYEDNEVATVNDIPSSTLGINGSYHNSNRYSVEYKNSDNTPGSDRGDDRGATVGYVRSRTDSDERLKTDIKDLEDQTERYMNLRPVSFKFKDGVQEIDEGVRYGLIAQEVDDDLRIESRPVKGSIVEELCGETYYRLKYQDLHALHIQMIQKQQRKIEELEERIARLEDKA